MSSKIERKEHNIVVIDIEVSKEDFQASMDRAFKKNSGRFSIPGFRKGKAPIGMVKRYYGEGVLYDDAIDDCINPAYNDAIKEHDLQPVSQPDLEIQEIGSDKGLKATITVTNKPSVELGQYKGVEAVRPNETVGDDAVQQELERVQQRNVRMIPVDDRAVQDGDTVTIDYRGLKDGEAFDGGTAEGQNLVIGSGSFIPGFEDQVIGHEIGDEFKIELSFPEEYHAKELAGQPVVFEVKLHDIKVKEVPELNDDFAMDVSEFDTLEAYKADILRDLNEKAKEHADRVFEQNAIQAATDHATIDLPAVMVDQEAEGMYRQQEQQMRGMGFTMDQYLQYLGQTKQDVLEQLKGDAERRVRTTLVLEAIANEEKFEVTDEDREAEFARLADQYHMEVDRIKEMFGQGSDMIDEDIRIHKAVELIRNSAVAIESQETDTDNETEEEA